MLVVAVVAVACTSVDPPAPAPVEPVITAPQSDPYVRFLLEEAAQLVRDNYLTTPLDDNAYLRYLQVLALEPDNQEAEQGLSNIVEKYLAFAINNVQLRRLGKATHYLNKARSIDETHPNIAAVSAAIESAEQSSILEYTFRTTVIEAQGAEVIEQLRDIGATIGQLDASIVIQAPSDRMGRWIYQQLNEVEEQRVRARFTRASQVRIQLQY